LDALTIATLLTGAGAGDTSTGVVDTFACGFFTDTASTTNHFGATIGLTGAVFVAVLAFFANHFGTGICNTGAIFTLFIALTGDLGAGLDAMTATAEFIASAGLAFAGVA
jgi:hypothetical protein